VATAGGSASSFPSSPPASPPAFAPPSSPSPRRARRYRPDHLNESTRFFAPPRTAHAVVPPLSAKLAASPYHESPFAYAEYLESTRDPGRWAPLYTPRRERVRPLRLARTPKTYGPDPASDYLDRTRLMRSMDFEFRDALKEKYREEFAETPYHELLLRTRAKGLEISAQRAQERDNQWIRQRIRENSEVKAAKKESYKHDLYHLDEIYPYGHRALRVIPVTDRHESDLPPTRRHLI
jgi:hypothetical protein